MSNPYVIDEIDLKNDGEAWRNIIRLQQITFPYDLTEVPDTGAWFIAYHNDWAVAFAGLTDFALKRRKTGKQVEPAVKQGYLSRCGVTHAHRGKGLQRDLVAARICKARELGYAELISTTFNNPHSSNNLIACGFRMYEPKHPWGYDGVNYWKLVL